MENGTLSQKTTLKPNEVITRAIHFFSTSKWILHSQSSTIVTFRGKSNIGCSPVLVTMVLLIFAVIPGLIYFYYVRTHLPMVNIVVSANDIDSKGSEVIVSYPQYEDKRVKEFISTLPPFL